MIDEVQFARQYNKIYYTLLDDKDEFIYLFKFNDLIYNSNLKYFSDLFNIEKILKYLKKHFSRSYKFTVLVYLKSLIISNLYKIIKILEFNESTITFNSINIINYIISVNEYMLSYMCSYNLFPTGIKQKTQKSEDVKKNVLTENSENIIYTDESIKAWFIETKHECINRLELLVNQFGLRTLLTFDIKLINYNKLLEMEPKEVIKTYNRCKLNIDYNLKYITDNCSIFKKCDDIYFSMFLTGNSDIDDESYNKLINNFISTLFDDD